MRGGVLSLGVLLAGLGLLALGGQGVGVASPSAPGRLPGPAPSEMAVRVLSLDDPTAAQRVLAIRLQSTGEGGGTVMPLRALDGAAVAAWLRRIDALDRRSHLAPALAALLFGVAADRSEARRLARLLGELGAEGPAAR